MLNDCRWQQQKLFFFLEEALRCWKRAKVKRSRTPALGLALRAGLQHRGTAQATAHVKAAKQPLPAPNPSAGAPGQAWHGVPPPQRAETESKPPLSNPRARRPAWWQWHAAAAPLTLASSPALVGRWPFHYFTNCKKSDKLGEGGLLLLNQCHLVKRGSQKGNYSLLRFTGERSAVHCHPSFEELLPSTVSFAFQTTPASFPHARVHTSLHYTKPHT